MYIRTQGQKHHRKRLGFHLCYHRFINALGKALAHTRDLVTHIGGGRIGVSGQCKAHRNLAALLAALRGDYIHPFNARKRVFQHLGHLGFHHFAGCPGKCRGHRHHRLVNLGVLAHRQASERHRAHQHDEQGQHGRENRAADRSFCKLHGVSASRRSWPSPPDAAECRPSVSAAAPPPPPHHPEQGPW